MEGQATNRVVRCVAQEPYRIFIEFADGTSGTAHLADLAGRGVFRLWDLEGGFASARVGPEGQVAWGDEIELCPDALYMRLKQAQPEDVFPLLAHSAIHA
jgi:hypothetical protein